MTPELAARTIFVDVHNTMLKPGGVNYGVLRKMIELVCEGMPVVIFSSKMDEALVKELKETLRNVGYLDLINLPMLNKSAVNNMALAVVVDNNLPQTEGITCGFYLNPNNFMNCRIEKIEKKLRRAWANRDSGCTL